MEEHLSSVDSFWVLSTTFSPLFCFPLFSWFSILSKKRDLCSLIACSTLWVSPFFKPLNRLFLSIDISFNWFMEFIGLYLWFPCVKGSAVFCHCIADQVSGIWGPSGIWWFYYIFRLWKSMILFVFVAGYPFQNVCFDVVFSGIFGHIYIPGVHEIVLSTFRGGGAFGL